DQAQVANHPRHLGAGGHSMNQVELARRVDAVCNRFEAAWRVGPPPRVEDFLEGWSGAERAALLRELVLLGGGYRRQGGLPCCAEDYPRRFPELSPAWVADAVAAPSILSTTTPTPHDGAPGEGPLAGRVCSSGTYELGEEIGAGGVGVVYRARDLGLG